MRPILVGALATIAFAATTTIQPREACYTHRLLRPRHDLDHFSFNRCEWMRVYSNANTRFQSFFMSTTVHLFRAAASKAMSSFPKWDWRS